MTELPDGVHLATAGAMQIAYESLGDPAHPPVMLIHGLATQMLGWPDGFCAALVARGLWVTRIDNRDVGLSTHLHDAPPVDLQGLAAGDFSTAPYRLSDMAGDVLGVLDALGLDSAHLVGASMGGTIAQTVAIEHPARVRSLVSIMSTTGDPAVGQPSREALAALLAPAATDREGAIQRTLAAYRVVGSPGFPFDEEGLRDRTGRAFDRAHDPAGVARQLAAVWASGDRSVALREVRVPTVVLHGRDDPLAHVSGGEATARLIPGAELTVFDGMGHDLPEALWPAIVDRIAGLVALADAE